MANCQFHKIYQKQNLIFKQTGQINKYDFIHWIPSNELVAFEVECRIHVHTAHWLAGPSWTARTLRMSIDSQDNKRRFTKNL